MVGLVGMSKNLLKIIGLCTVASILNACQSLPTASHLSPQLSAHSPNTTPPTLNSNKKTPLKSSTLSGYYPIATGSDAFAARSILTDKARHRIDIQYYIWHDDEAGILMLKDLWEAAGRGVQVRLLLDDMNSSPSLDELLLHFASHPNISVRLSNPAVYRKFRAVNFLTEPLRINRRMHNKSMTFDSTLSIIGGRNIGNEYLNNSHNRFADLDVLLTGAVVGQIERSFEEYWQSPVSYDIETLIKIPLKPDFIPPFALEDRLAHAQADSESQILKSYRHAIKNARLGKDLVNDSIQFRWANVQFLADPADKLTDTPSKDEFLIHQLKAQLGQPKRKFSVISSYFVPTRDGVAGLVALAKSGVKVQILTNSYHATDVGTAHSGYAHWRADLLKAGIRLFELKASATFNTAQKQGKKEKLHGKSSASLHAKAFAIDNEQVFIGSYNLDPRSANINSELGVIIQDTLLTTRLHNAFGDNLLNQAYEVKLIDDKLEWHTLENGQLVIYHQEPNIKPHKQLGIYALSWLPIDWLL